MRQLSISFSAMALVAAILALAEPASARPTATRLPDKAPAWKSVNAWSSASVLRRAPASFAARYGGAWWERRGGPTGDFRRVFGSGIPLDPAAACDEQVAIDEVERFFEDNAELLPGGVDTADLVLRRTIGWKGKRIVAFAQHLDGVEIEGAVAYAVLAGSRLVLWGTRLYPVATVPAEPVIGLRDAERIALWSLLGRRGTPEIAPGVRYVLVPLVGADSLELAPAFAVPLRISGRGKWTAFVNARTGALIDLRDERVTMDGTIQIEHHDRNPAGGLIAGAGAYLDLTANGSETTTDGAGAYTATGDFADITSALEGQYVEVTSDLGDDLALNVTDLADNESYLWSSDGSEIQQAQLDAYVFALAVSEHARSLQDDVVWLEQALPVTVNVLTDFNYDGIDDYCNAWSDGDGVFLMMARDEGGSGCNSPAMIADITYHEYGHCLHMQNAYSYGVGILDNSVGEAFADTMSVSMTHDSVIARDFRLSGAGIRDVAPDKVYPDDLADDEHTSGLILGGALWDLRGTLVAELGENEGHRATDEIFMDMLRLTENMPSAFEAAVIADDDNGDMSDGSPNFCEICDAFEPHGLGGGALARIWITHEPVWFSPDAGATIPLEATVTVPVEECATLGEVRVVYSTDSGESWAEEPMAPLGGDVYVADLPAFPAGTELRYRIEVEELDTEQLAVRPVNPAEPYYTTYIGPLTEILCDDFEGPDEGGWTHKLLAGEPEEGADDWQRGTPTGKGGDPDGAFSGINAWGNDLGLDDEWNGQYQYDKRNALSSPTYNLSQYENVRLVFRRWLNVEDGYFDRARVYVNEEVVWSNTESEGGENDNHTTNHEDSEWILVDIDVSSFAGGQDEVEVRFELESDFWYVFGGWNIDDFCFYTADAIDASDAGADAGEEPIADAGADAAIDGSADDTVSSSGACDCRAAGVHPERASLLSALLVLF